MSKVIKFNGGAGRVNGLNCSIEFVYGSSELFVENFKEIPT
jgi:hypothetical protein